MDHGARGKPRWIVSMLSRAAVVFAVVAVAATASTGCRKENCQTERLCTPLNLLAWCVSEDACWMQGVDCFNGNPACPEVHMPGTSNLQKIHIGLSGVPATYTELTIELSVGSWDVPLIPEDIQIVFTGTQPTCSTTDDLVRTIQCDRPPGLMGMEISRTSTWGGPETFVNVTATEVPCPLVTSCGL